MTTSRGRRAAAAGWRPVLFQRCVAPSAHPCCSSLLLEARHRTATRRAGRDDGFATPVAAPLLKAWRVVVACRAQSQRALLSKLALLQRWKRDEHQHCTLTSAILLMCVVNQTTTLPRCYPARGPHGAVHTAMCVANSDAVVLSGSC